MRPALLIGLTVVAFGLCVAGGLVWHSVLWRTGWFQGPPPIVKGLITGIENGPWTRRLRETYPPGTLERTLIESLEDQHFKVYPEVRRAAYGWADYPCVVTLTVSWRAQGGQVRAIQGALHNACTDPDRLLPQPGPRAPRPARPQPSLVVPTQSA